MQVSFSSFRISFAFQHISVFPYFFFPLISLLHSTFRDSQWGGIKREKTRGTWSMLHRFRRRWCWCCCFYSILLLLSSRLVFYNAKALKHYAPGYLNTQDAYTQTRQLLRITRYHWTLLGIYFKFFFFRKDYPFVLF